MNDNHKDEEKLSEYGEEYSFTEEQPRTEARRESMAHSDEETFHEDIRDKFSDSVKNNIVYVVIIAVLIVPAGFALKKMFSEPEKVVVTQDLSITNGKDVQAAPTASDKMHPTHGDTEIDATMPTAPPLRDIGKPLSGDMSKESALTKDSQFGRLNESTLSLQRDLKIDQNTTTNKQSTAAPVTKDIEKTLFRLNLRINDINKKLDNLAQVPKELATLQTAQASGRTLDSDRIAELVVRVSSLHQSVSRLEENLFREKLARSEHQVPVEGEQTQPYIVYASIPGRAWLRNPDGKLVTVREGDEIPGFGKVEKIDAKAGTVTMTNAVFKQE